MVSNGVGSATSVAATLTVTAAPIPPTVISQPANQTVAEGDPATFSVVATGDNPLTYQWRRNSVVISGEVNASLNLATTTIAESGDLFDVVVSNGVGSATSAPAILTVLPDASDPVTITLAVTNGWDQKNDKTLANDAKLYVVQTGDDEWWSIESDYFTRFEFEAVPDDAIVSSVKVYFEYWQEEGMEAGSMIWHVDTNGLTNNTVSNVLTITAPDHHGENAESVAEWEVCDSIVTCSALPVDDLKIVVQNIDGEGKKSLLDKIWVDVTFNP